MNRLFYILFLLLLSFRVSAMTNTEAIQYVNRYYDLLNQYAVVKNDAPGLARQITSMHVENAGSIYPDIEVKLGGLPDTKGVVISTYLTSISDPERKRSMLLKFVPRDIIIKSNSGGVTCVSYTLYVYDDNATPNSSVLKYSVPLEMRINQYYKIKTITKRVNSQDYDDTPKTPNVSRKVLIHNGHEYVDLGLSVMWATCNVGAESPEEYGDYFAWGEVKSKKEYHNENYMYFKDNSTMRKSSIITKYNTRSDEGIVDHKTQLELNDDAASYNWRGSWRLPTQLEIEELHDQCIWTWTIKNGVKGYTIKSKRNGNNIFLPAAGEYFETIRKAGTNGFYWSSSLHDVYGRKAQRLLFLENTVSCFGYGNRYLGHPVRPVFSPH